MQRVVCERLTSLNVALLGFICVAAVSAFHFFSVPNSLPPRGRTAFASGTFGGSPAWSVWLLLLRSFVHTFLCGHLFPFLLLTAAGAEPPSPRAALRTCRAVRGVPSSACGSGLSTPSPTLVTFFHRISCARSGVLWFWFSFLCRLMMLRIFIAHWPFCVSLGKCRFISFVYFLIGSSSFLLLNYKSFLCILYKVLCQLHDCSHSPLSSVFPFLRVSSEAQKLSSGWSPVYPFRLLLYFWLPKIQLPYLRMHRFTPC